MADSAREVSEDWRKTPKGVWWNAMVKTVMRRNGTE